MLVIQHLDKARRIAARRDVIAPRALGAQQCKGAGGDEGARWRIQPIGGFVCGGFRDLIIQGFKFRERGDGVLNHGSQPRRTRRRAQEKEE